MFSSNAVTGVIQSLVVGFFTVKHRIAVFLEYVLVAELRFDREVARVDGLRGELVRVLVLATLLRERHVRIW
jgi:hypothetical protein